VLTIGWTAGDGARLGLRRRTEAMCSPWKCWGVTEVTIPFISFSPIVLQRAPQTLNETGRRNCSGEKPFIRLSTCVPGNDDGGGMDVIASAAQNRPRNKTDSPFIPSRTARRVCGLLPCSRKSKGIFRTKR